jgi:hypothetical protein
MAVKNRPGAAREALGRQAARDRRNAPGKRFVGDRHAQQAADRAREVGEARRLAEIHEAERRAAAHPEPAVAVLAELVQDAVRLGRTLLSAPLRIALAWRAGRVGAG